MIAIDESILNYLTLKFLRPGKQNLAVKNVLNFFSNLLDFLTSSFDMKCMKRKICKGIQIKFEILDWTLIKSNLKHLST